VILKKAPYIIVILIVIFITQSTESLFGQNQTDTISKSVVIVKHSPKKASIYSLILPGAGQVYNKKYWKVPIIYIGFGALIYSATWNNGEYNRFKDAYLTYPNDEFEGRLGQEQLLNYINGYRRSRDLSFIGMFALWGLNIIDASVDAHFFDYDISEDLSLNFKPTYKNTLFSQPEFGIKLALNF